jgi:hypothetical protein
VLPRWTRSAAFGVGTTVPVVRSLVEQGGGTACGSDRRPRGRCGQRLLQRAPWDGLPKWWPQIYTDEHRWDWPRKNAEKRKSRAGRRNVLSPTAQARRPGYRGGETGKAECYVEWRTRIAHQLARAVFRAKSTWTHFDTADGGTPSSLAVFAQNITRKLRGRQNRAPRSESGQESRVLLGLAGRSITESTGCLTTARAGG